MIDGPTRVTSASATLLDLIITIEPSHALEKFVVPQVIADHDLIGIKINLRKPKREPLVKTFRHFDSYNKDIVCDLLLSESYSLNRIIRTDDVNQQISIFNNSFIKCLDKCAPNVTEEITKHHAPWLNDDLRQAMRKKDEARNNQKRDRINLTLLQYTDEKKNVKSCITATKKRIFAKLQGCKGNTSTTRNIIKEILPNQKKSTSTHDFENTSNKAEEFNHFFASVSKDT